MPKSYALIEIMDTLDQGAITYYISIIDALNENNIKDVYFFTNNMSFGPEIFILIENIKSLLRYQRCKVQGVLTIYDLFWGIEHQLKSLATNEQLKFYMAGDHLIQGGRYQRHEVLNIEKLVEEVCPDFSKSLYLAKPCTKDILGAAYRDIDKPDLSERVAGAAQAAKMFLKCYPAKYSDFDGFLIKHFIENKPDDCTNCIIFYNRKQVSSGCSSLSDLVMNGNHAVNVMKIDARQEDFERPLPKEYYNLTPKEYFSSLVRPFLSLLNLVKSSVSNALSIVELQNTLNHLSFEWCTWISRLELNYYTHRGFKFFGYSSDESLNLLTQLKSADLNIYAKRTMIINYLSNDRNKGKRLFDVLFESLVRESKRLPRNESDIWLTENILYLIQKKYQIARGFKLFGNSCSDSIILLNKLNEDISLAEKQGLIDNYLANPNFRSKRLFNVLNEVRNLDDNAKRKYQLKG